MMVSKVYFFNKDKVNKLMWDLKEIKKMICRNTLNFIL